MAGKEEYRIFVGGLSWDVTERQMESAFQRFGKVLEAQIMMERDTNRPRGFGFITFGDRRAMEDAIREMHGRELGDRIISVNKAQPKMGGGGAGEDSDHYRGGGYSSGDRRNYGGGDRPVGQDECFKCGRPGHWARDCPSAGGGRGGGRGGGGSFSSHSRFGAGGRGDRFGGDRGRYMDDRYDGGRYGDRDRFDSRDDKYGSRDRYVSDRYPAGDRFASDRYGGSDRYPQNGYGKDRGYDRDGGPRGGDRYASGGPARDDNYRSRPGPYDRPSRGGRPSSFDRY
ncbi:glycine-rich RNA-binding protein RZ1C-like isoform X1 [Malus sylvestris]|uniref:glycine-rich RNA-binding protein RZ1C-like isoform X1 n=2 Tax=Malus sylvestris TaxID=3752 RepID=UPI0021AD2825|nr:glycine-rich RNA-binding protein RZ1C-like isoform X1 [Malus sylvestris]